MSYSLRTESGIKNIVNDAIKYDPTTIAELTTLITTVTPGGGQVNTVLPDTTSTGLTLKSTQSTASDIKIKGLLAGTNVTLNQSGSGDVVISASGGSSSAYTPLSLIYLDNSYTGTVSDGGIFTPFKTLPNAFTYINTLSPGSYKLMISSTGLSYGPGGTGVSWSVGNIQLSMEGVSGKVEIDCDFSFLAFSIPASCTIEVSNIIFTGANSFDVSTLINYSVLFRDCVFTQGNGVTCNSVQYGKIMFDNCKLSVLNIIGQGRCYLNNCDITNDITLSSAAVLKSNNCRFDFAARIVLAQASSIFLQDIEHLSTSATNFLFSFDNTANRAYIDDASLGVLPTGPALAGGTGLGTTFLISGLVRESLTAGSGISLTQNFSNGKTTISVPFVPSGVQTVLDDTTATGQTLISSQSTSTDIKLKELVQGTGITLTQSGTGNLTIAATGSGGATNLSGLTDAYHNVNAISVGFKPTTPANYNASNIFVSNTQPTNITATSEFNTAVGTSSLVSLTTGQYNCAYGPDALLSVTSGSNNTAVGLGSGTAITTGSNNTILGRQAQASGAAANRIALGYNSVATVDNGLNTHLNLANQVGTNQKVLTYANSNGQIGGLPDGSSGQALITNGSGLLSWGSVSGATSINGLSDGYNNLPNNAYALGFKPTNPLNFTNNVYISQTDPTSILTTAAHNTAVGNAVLPALTTGDNNIGLGKFNLTQNTTGNRNIAIGSSNCNSVNISGSDNINIGCNSEVSSNNSNGRISIGNNVTNSIDNSLSLPPTLANQVGATQRALVFSVSTGQVGPINDGTAGQALITDGSGSLSWGTVGGGGATNIDGLSDGRKDTTNKILNLGFKGTTTGVNQIWITPNSQPVGMTNAATGNIVISGAVDSMQSLTTGTSNVVISSGSSLRSMTIGTNNTAINTGSLRNTLGNNNTGVGTDAGRFLATGDFNTFLGSGCSPATLFPNTTGSIIVGGQSFLGNTNNNEQMVIGYGITGCGVTRSLTLTPLLSTQAGTANRVMTFSTATGQVAPINDGTSGQFLTTNGSGSLSWTTVSGGGGGGIKKAYGYVSPVSLPASTNTVVSGLTWNALNSAGTWNTTGSTFNLVNISSGTFITVNALCTISISSAINSGSFIIRLRYSGNEVANSRTEYIIPTSSADNWNLTLPLSYSGLYDGAGNYDIQIINTTGVSAFALNFKVTIEVYP
jgi:hypothetical protein